MIEMLLVFQEIFLELAFQESLNFMRFVMGLKIEYLASNDCLNKTYF